MGKTLYTLNVLLIEGPVSQAFIKANPDMCRTIEIRGDQTLEQLHTAILGAFDRSEDHGYEFHLGEDPDDMAAVRYGLTSSGETPLLMSVSLEDDFELSVIDDPVGEVTTTTLTDLGLTVGRLFGYWFDFDAYWYHNINVIAIGEAGSTVKYPMVTGRTGESPPQHPSLDDEAGQHSVSAPGSPEALRGEQKPRPPRPQRRGPDTQSALQFDDE